MNWLMSANSKMYDHASSFEHYGFIDWRQGKTKFSIGDIIYIYCTKPAQRIRYKCKVQKLDMSFNEIRDDREYWNDESEYEKALHGLFFKLQSVDQVDTQRLNLEHLKSHGLKAAPQSPMKLHGNILSYIESEFLNIENDDFFPELINTHLDVYEGLKKQVTVNKYERSSIARARCVEHHGYACKVCGFDFKQFYGDVGDEFIHVHHIKPLHAINQSYRINYEADLIPVCPNCHAMLHRKVDGSELSIDELRNEMQKNKRG